MNFLEQLVAEWYAYKGCFVRTNIKFGKRSKGGYEGEIDVAAFDPKTKHLIHIEASSAADSWPEHKERFVKKFKNAKAYYKDIFDFQFDKVENKAIVGFVRNPKTTINFGNNINVMLIPDFIQEITQHLKELHPMKSAVPEGYPLLRAIQFAVYYGIKN